MSLERLQDAYDAVQMRKEAGGAPNIEDVLEGRARPTRAYESPGLALGTDLTNEEIEQFGAIIAVQCIEVFSARNRIFALTILTSVGEEIIQALVTAACEAMLVGIEYGRRLERDDNA